MLFSSKKVVAVDIGSSSIKVAELDVNKSGANLVSFGIVQTPPDAISSGELVSTSPIASALVSLITELKIKRKNAATNISGSSVIVKKITMPRMETDLVGEQIKWEAEQYIPFDINEISLQFHILETFASSDTMDVLLVAAKKDYVLRHVSVIEEAGLKCSVLDVSNFALANCFEINYGKLNETVALLNIGCRVTNFVVLEAGEAVFCRDIPIGGMNYTADIHKELGVSIEEAESLKMSAVMQQEVPQEVNTTIQATTEVMTDEIQNSFDFFLATANNTTINRFFVTGGCAGVPGLVQQISQSLNIGFEVLNPFLKVGFNAKKHSPEYIEQIKPYASIAIGLGLRAIGDS